MALSSQATLIAIELVEASLKIAPIGGTEDEAETALVLPAVRWRAEPPDFEAAELGLSVNWELDEERLQFASLIRTSLRLQTPEFDELGEEARIDGPPEVTAIYRLTYEIRDADVSDDECAMFAHWNVPYNVWPFWRELVANLLQRTGVTEMMVPLFRVPGIRPDDEDPESAEEE